jgi:hypothetical protein
VVIKIVIISTKFESKWFEDKNYKQGNNVIGVMSDNCKRSKNYNSKNVALTPHH